MKPLWKKLSAIGVAALAVVLLVGQAADESESESGSWPDIAEEVLDRLVDSNLVAVEADHDDPLVQRRVLVVSGDVNARMAARVSAQLLYLDEVDPRRTPIDLYIRTEGGWYEDAFMICDVMERIGSPVNTWAAGGTNSAGAIILAAGTGKRRALPNSVIMLHTNTNAGDDAHSLELVHRNRMERFWKAKARLPDNFFPMNAEKFYYLSPEEAVELGVVDEIYRKK